MDRTLPGRRALVTGGASGIGAAIARELAGRGAHVTIADLDAGGARALATEVGGESWVVDLSDTHALDELQLDVDILVNNAGIQKVAAIEAYDPADFRRIHAIMLEA